MSIMRCARNFQYVDREWMFSSMNDGELVLVHSGIACARIHELKGGREWTHELSSIEYRIFHERKTTPTTTCGIDSRRVEMSVREVRTLFTEQGWLPRTTFKCASCKKTAVRSGKKCKFARSKKDAGQNVG